MAATDTKTLDGHTLSTRVTPAQDMQECGGFLIRVITQGLSETPLHALAINSQEDARTYLTVPDPVLFLGSPRSSSLPPHRPLLDL